MKPLRLPGNLERKLRAFERRLFRVESLLAVSFGVSGLLGAFVALFVLDRVWETPSAMRLLLGGLALGCLLVAAALWLRRWLWRRRSLIELALLVQQRHQRLGDRLQGILELAGARERGDNGMSPALREAAIKQVAAECEQYDFRQAVRRRPAWRAFAFLALLVLLCGGLWLSFPEASASSLQRLFSPFAAMERYTFVRFDSLPAERTVVHGEPFSQLIRLDVSSRWQPQRARVIYGTTSRDVEFVDGAAQVEIAGLTMPVQLTVRAGDGMASMRLVPVHRPTLERLRAIVALPDYLQHPARQVEAGGQTLTVLQGSSVTLIGEMSQPLSSATLTLEAGQKLQVDGRRLETTPLPVEGQLNLTLSWQNRHGFAPHQPRVLTIMAEEDMPPRVSCPSNARAVAILPHEALPIAIHAQDDYGIRQIGLRYEVSVRAGARGVTPFGQTDTVHTLFVAAGDPERRTLDAMYDLVPAALGIGVGHLIRFKATAADYRPDARAAESTEHLVHILSHAEHAELIRERMSQVQAGIEEVARSEASLLEGKHEMLQQDETWMRSPEADSRIRQQELDEAANTAALQSLARDALELMKEAMRNETFDQQALEEWSTILSSLQSIAHQDMPELTETMRRARQQREQRQSELAEARDQQQKILEKLRDLGGEMNESLEGVIARSFAMRLRELADQEEWIRMALQELVGQVIGLAPEELPPAIAASLQTQIAAHQRIEETLAELYQDLRGFIQRTTIARYLEVERQMAGEGVPEALTRVGGLIRGNQLGQAIGATTAWSQRFRAWADLLDPQADGDGDGDGEAQEMTEQQLKAILTLLRTLQEEQQIRQNTRALERQRERLATYEQEAMALSNRQMANYDLLSELEDLMMSMQLKPLFTQVGMAMVDAATFLYEPRTDEQTIAAETEAIELLASLISSASQQLASGNPEMAALMMQMLGMMQGGMGSGSGPGGGGNMGAYTGSTADQDVRGRADGSGEQRSGQDRAGGAWSQQIPLEFREALEGYYRLLERLQEPSPPDDEGR